jgi:HEAT repeat protein
MLLILALPTLVGFRVLFDKDLDSASRTLFTCTGLLLTSLIVVGFMSLRKPSSTYQGQVIALAEIGDTSSISRLIDALDTGDPSARRRAEVAVSVLLPSITFETTSIVGTEQRAILHRHLGGDCVPLIIAILNSMRHFRDASALPMLERLASSEKPAVSRDPAVSKALADVLPLIREIAARNTGRRTLLRASTAGCVIAETALRPITETPDTRDQELLRAGGSHVRE